MFYLKNPKQKLLMKIKRIYNRNSPSLHTQKHSKNQLILFRYSLFDWYWTWVRRDRLQTFLAFYPLHESFITPKMSKRSVD